jgi:hypothetical protein
MAGRTRQATRALEATRQNIFTSYLKKLPEESRWENLGTFVRNWQRDVYEQEALPGPTTENPGLLPAVTASWNEGSNLLGSLAEVDITARDRKPANSRPNSPTECKYARGITAYSHVSVCRGRDEQGRLMFRTGINPHFQPPAGPREQYLRCRTGFSESGTPIWNVQKNPDFDPFSPVQPEAGQPGSERLILPWKEANAVLSGAAEAVELDGNDLNRLVEQLPDGVDMMTQYTEDLRSDSWLAPRTTKPPQTPVVAPRSPVGQKTKQRRGRGTGEQPGKSPTHRRILRPRNDGNNNSNMRQRAAGKNRKEPAYGKEKQKTPGLHKTLGVCRVEKQTAARRNKMAGMDCRK